MTTYPIDPFEDLLATLDLEELGTAQVSVTPTELSAGLDQADTGTQDVTLFRGKSQKMPHGRVFGGQVLAQGVMACGRTIGLDEFPHRRLHSLHAYFMRP